MHNPADELRRKRHEGNRPNHILLFTIINPLYPITVVSTNLVVAFFLKIYLNLVNNKLSTTFFRTCFKSDLLMVYTETQL